LLRHILFGKQLEGQITNSTNLVPALTVAGASEVSPKLDFLADQLAELADEGPAHAPHHRGEDDAAQRTETSALQGHSGRGCGGWRCGTVARRL